ncbi:unnamed protein product [Peronospora belbahrii]|uniref:SH3 domain-containing protein n=1 Tax=Peronospora belbahrii TaxID=622444 RepID=A0ABN8CPN4_9STRA|nr:unnamed protein product [Peronospora belbahrii]
MSSAQSQNDIVSPAEEQPMNVIKQNASTTAITCAPVNKAQKMQDHHSRDVYIAVNAMDGTSPSKKRRRTRSGTTESDLRTYGTAVAFQHQAQRSIEEMKDSEEDWKENGHVDDEIDASKENIEDCGEVSVNEEPGKHHVLVKEEPGKRHVLVKEEPGKRHVSVNEEPEKHDELASQSLSQETDSDERRVGVSLGKQEMSTLGDVSTIMEAMPSTSSLPSQVVHRSSVDMVFPEDEVPIELCLFSSDGSVEPTHAESPPRPSNNMKKASPQAASTTPKSPPLMSIGIPLTSTGSTSTASTFMTAVDTATQIVVNRTMRRRRRRKKFSFSSTRSKATAKANQEQGTMPASPALVDMLLSTSVNGHSAKNGAEVKISSNAPPSPIYPAADASHLYPTTSEGMQLRWEDVDPFFGPIAQSDLDNLMRWRRENANFIAANPKAWRGASGMESKRALLATMDADASDALTEHVEFPMRRGRSYVDVWEEIDFLDRLKHDSFVSKTQMKNRMMKRKTKRKGVIAAETSLLVSYRDLVYGYDDDRFQEFRDHLVSRVKACQSDLLPATPPTPSTRRQQNASTNVDDNVAQTLAEEVEFDEEVLPSLPICQLHPASLGLWKLCKKQEPDYSVVHPASVNRSQVPARWKEEMEHHHQRQYEFQLQQTDEFADPSDGDDEGTGDSIRDRFRATILNHQVTGTLPSFGNSMEEDEISQTLAASIRSLIPLSIYNWRTAQLVYERAACSIQCAPILEGEAAAAKDLEDMFLQLCSSSDTSADVALLHASGSNRKPRVSQIIRSTPHDMIAHSVRYDVADNCSLAVVASVEFALRLSVGDVVDVLDRNGCWNYGEVMETYSDDTLGVVKFLLMQFSLWPEDTVEWISASEGRILPQGVADGSRSCSVGPTRAHRVRIQYDQSLARELELSLPQRQEKQAIAASQVLTQWQHDIVVRSTSDLQKMPQKRKRKRPAKSALVATTPS